ncbi:acyltransferase [Dyadobacter sandarakinus]|uniref:Acyltransferase n=1 Tax=Dyadobacter sandarakinus TaxID=2747268 RepID=A0ABX7ID99_9BACT|nr:acyltransferase [Dyadobacter sandarakinus]
MLLTPKIESIQVLRGIAALLVTIYHLKDITRNDDPFKAELDFLFNSGAAGVSLFFLISGFIMVYTTRGSSSRKAATWYFLVRRLVRIWPVYAIITLAYYYLVHRFQAPPGAINMLLRSLAFYPAAAVDPPFYGYATLSIGWSLNYEIYFYALVGICMLFGRARWYVFFAWSMLTLIALPAYLGFFTLQPHLVPDYGHDYVNLITNPVIWNFVAGVVVGLVYCQPGLQHFMIQLFSRKWLFAACISLGTWQYLSGFFGGLGILQWGAGSLLVLCACLFHYAGKNTRLPGALVWVGDVSFSIYLLHLPVLVTFTLIFQKLGYPIYSSGTAFLLLTTAVTLIAAHFSHEYLEVKLSAYLKKHLIARS